MLVLGDHITLAFKYPNVVIPAEAGIQKNTGCRIRSGMTEFGYLVAGLITMIPVRVDEEKVCVNLCGSVAK